MSLKLVLALSFATVIFTTSEFLSVPNESDIDWDEWEGLELSDRQSMTQSCKCGAGVSRLNITKIVGGVTSRNHAWPWMGAIVYTKGSKPQALCGGSLINNWYLLTAAHCAVAIQENGVNNFQIYLGSNRIIANTTRTDLVKLSISAIKINSKYNSTTLNNDIAVLRFNTPVNFSSTINPVCLTQKGDPFVGHDAIVAGWGITVFGTQNTSNSLRETHLKVVSNSECNQTFRNIKPQMICAYAPNKDSCQGDSGGPLITKLSSGKKSDVYEQIGVVSFGKGCGQIGSPGVYTRVAKFINWIKAQTKGAMYCSNSFGPSNNCPTSA